MLQNATFIQDIGAITNTQRFTNIVVGNQNANMAFFQFIDNFLDIKNRYGVNSSKRLIKQDKSRLQNKGKGNLDASPLAPGKRKTVRFCNMRQAKVFE